MLMPSPFLVHRGVRVYRITKDDRELVFWYSLLSGRDESDPNIVDAHKMDFDVRTLAEQLRVDLTNDNHAEVIREAIDKGIIKPRRVFNL